MEKDYPRFRHGSGRTVIRNSEFDKCGAQRGWECREISVGILRNSAHLFLVGVAMLIAFVLLLVSLVLALVERAITSQIVALWAIGAALILPNISHIFR